MLRHSVTWILMLCVLPITALLALGPARADQPQVAAPLFCTYLPFVGAVGPSQGAAPAQRGGACPQQPEALTRLSGQVRLLPEHRVIEHLGQPLQIVVVLDQSGSMSANFRGQCDTRVGGGTPPARNFPGEPAAFWQCANPPLYDTNGDGIGDFNLTERVTGVGPDYYWANRDERRITVAKKALETLIKQTNMPGNVHYTTAFPADQMALVWFNDTVQRAGNAEVFAGGKNFTSDSNALISAMWSRTTSSAGDRYRTEGGTNATAGLYRASLVSDAAPKEVVHTDGRTYKYKQVVLLLTDGITNQFFHEAESDLRVAQSSANTYPNGSACRTLGALVVENADCQTTAVGGIYTTTVAGATVGLDRPMTQLVMVSQNYLQRNGVLVYVVVLSHLQATSFVGAASFPNFFHHVPDLVVNTDGTTILDTVIKGLIARSIEEICRAEVAPAYTNTMAVANRPIVATLTFPNVGVVQLKNTATGMSFSAPIVADADGKLSYTFASVPPGTYTLNATLYYKGEDGFTRAYQRIDQQGDLVSALTVDVSGSTPLQLDLAMRLGEHVCATP